MSQNMQLVDTCILDQIYASFNDNGKKADDLSAICIVPHPILKMMLHENEETSYNCIHQ